MRHLLPLLLAALVCVANPVLAQDASVDAAPGGTEADPAVRAMLAAAMKAGDEAAVNAIVKYAKVVDKTDAAVAERAASEWRKERKEAAERRIREARFVDLIKGRAELGGYATSGNSDTVGLTGVLDLKREGLDWRHKFRVQADYQESLGQTVRERFLAAYEPNYKIDDRAYVYGAAQFESDRFLGFEDRYSASAGAGYTAIKRTNVKLDLELGPAFRHTNFTDDSVESQLAARGKLDFDWTLRKGITLSQDASAYLQAANSTITGKTALRARLFGPFSAQMSYALNYESAPPIGRKTTDTTSRASLLIDF
jgi:putative salt-induced outer membrane protein